LDHIIWYLEQVFSLGRCETYSTLFKRLSAYGLHFQATSSSQSFFIKALCDSDWASNIDDRHSTYGVAIYFGPNLGSWWSKKQLVVARSSIKVEFWCLASVAA